MNKEKIQNKIDELQKQIDILKKQVNETKKIDKYPELGTEFYYTADSGEIYFESWENTEWDRYNYGINNCYPFDKYTEEDVEKEKQKIIEKAKIERIMRKYARPFELGEEHWYIKWNGYYGSIDVGVGCTSVPTNYYFESKEITQKVVKLCGEEKLKKYYFEIEE